ncbi:hypothetical protein ACHAXT_007980 [Thalassiosira profunda]
MAEHDDAAVAVEEAPGAAPAIATEADATKESEVGASAENERVTPAALGATTGGGAALTPSAAGAPENNTAATTSSIVGVGPPQDPPRSNQDSPPPPPQDPPSRQPGHYPPLTGTYNHPTHDGYHPPTQENYNPIYPANTATLARYDSGIFDTGTSDDEEEDEDEEVEDEEYEASGDSLVLDSSADVASRETNEAGEDGKSASVGCAHDGTGSGFAGLYAHASTAHAGPPSTLFEDNEAASVPSSLAALPRTHRPFQTPPGNSPGVSEAADCPWEKGDTSYAPSRAVKTHGRDQPTMGEDSPWSAYTRNLPYEAPRWDIPPRQHTPQPPSQQPPTQQYKSYDSEYTKLPPIPFHSLPIDALHAVSTYCTPKDWASLGACNKAWRSIGREIFHKVWRHAGKCVMEVSMAWARGEHADARELAGLYLKKGVGIYPAPGGHGYQGVAWRMGRELEAADSSQDGPTGEEEATTVGGGNDATEGGTGSTNIGGADEGGNNNGNTPTDPYYSDRYVENARDDRDVFSRNHLTYVEEKAAFCEFVLVAQRKKKRGIAVPSSGHAPFPPAPPARGSLFPRRFSFEGGGINHIARGPPQAAAPQAAPEAAPGAYGGGAPLARPQTARGPRSNAAHAASAFGSPPGGHPEAPPQYSVRRSSFSGTNNGSPFSSHHQRRNSELDRGVSSHNAREAKSPPSIAAATSTAPKISIQIHRHLADQHFFGSPSVDDAKGAMSSSQVSMSADFYHPTWADRRALGNARMAQWALESDDSFTPAVEGDAMEDIGETVDQETEDALRLNRTDPGPDTANYRAAVRAFANWTLANTTTDRPQRRSLPPTNTAAGRLHALLANPSAWRMANDGGGSRPAGASPASDVHLDIYSAASATKENDADEATVEAVAEMRSRCEQFQKRLDALLTSNCNAFAFQEALLDFWDELLPATMGIHYYNQQSPVPRMSKLHSFLTNPCPKAAGTIQCEIERVRVSSKHKGKKMKGKFFPSYEYRLFIKDAKNDNPFNAARAPPRKDTVLLVAKTKGGKNRNVATERTGNGVGGRDLGSPSSVTGPGSRRGITNYYMCLPNQRDVDGHYKNSNRHNPNAASKPGESSGLPVSPMAVAASKERGGVGSVEVGRLQSNFIGTEFQIFVPNKTALARSARPAEPPHVHETSSSEGGREGDSKVHPIDVAVPLAGANAPRRTSGRRGSGLVRLARRASGHLSRRASRRQSEEPLADPADGESPKRRGSATKVIRRMSWGNKASKDPLDAADLASSSHSAAPAMMGEVENGAITYTANLLGNRPRIMDVCIPRLLEDGSVSEAWNGDRSTAATSMLELFKSIQQGMDIDDTLGEQRAAAANANGLLILQNRPPWWNVELGAFVLNFGGRVKVASVKNFQLCERTDRDHLMQFGRIEGRHAFTMDFGWPLTPLQAFAIAISSLQSKISFG